ncbi:hypothetical protein [Promicromonospora sp. NFX87]|uniref:hypothetical protein n=1 Tax=Promicromonospora sp. NFX87 TaxID=3402691 RepID=UPI003AFB4382
MTVLTANLADRTLAGLVLPFDEIGFTNLGAVQASRDSQLDFAETVTLNLEHNGGTIDIGSGILAKRDDGIYGMFRVDESPMGDAVLLEASEGKRNGFSIEIPEPIIRGGKILAGLINAVAAVVRPAFPSAMQASESDLMAEDTGEIPEELVIDGVSYTRTISQDDESEKEGTPVVTDNKLDENAKVDLSAAFAGNANKDKGAPLTAAKAFSAIAKGAATNNLQAALANVTHDDGDNDGDGVGEIAAAPGWLGEVYKEAAYNRKYVSLFTPGSLTSYREAGFRWSSKPTVAQYAGNKAEIPTGGITAEPVTYGTQRWAHGADLDRRFIDFGDQDVLRAFVEAQIESYLEVTDAYSLAQAIAAATDVERGPAVAGVNNTITQIVDGALALIGNDRTPTGAVVGLAGYRSLLLSPKDLVLEFLTQGMGLEEGSLAGFRIVPSANAALVGKSLVVDKSTVKFKEFGGGTPVRVEAQHVANGGVDLAVFGYTSFQDLTEDGIVLVADDLTP